MTSAQNVFRYKETHGEHPSDDQVKRMVQIAKDLEHKDYSHLTKDPYQHEFLRRKEGDFLFHHGPSPKGLSDQAARKMVQELESQHARDYQHSSQKDFSL